MSTGKKKASAQVLFETVLRNCKDNQFSGLPFRTGPVGTICVVPENIHTPTMEGIGNSRGVGGQKPRKFQRGGGVDGQINFQMVQFDSVPTYSCSC